MSSHNNSAELTPAQEILGPVTDYYHVFADVDGEDLAAWKSAAEHGARAVKEINTAWEAGHPDYDLIADLAERDLFTDGLEIEGHKHYSPLAAGLINMEVTRADGSMGTIVAVQGGLCMRSIAYFGSEEQKKKYLGPLAKGEIFGGFGLTEPDHGSDSVALETTAVKDGDHYVLNGQKRWIGFGATGDITVIWARTEDGGIGGFIVDQKLEGYHGEVIKGKALLRAIDQALITLDNVRVHESMRLPGVASFKDVGAIISATRVSVAWAALGHAIACFEIAREHALTRVQFGKPLAHFQLIQARLTNMLEEITSMSLHCRRMADMDAQGKLTPEMASMAKMYCARGARAVAADARDMLGGSGILLENHVIRHMVDLEALITYEGTDSVQSLIIGRAITGKGAFA